MSFVWCRPPQTDWRFPLYCDDARRKNQQKENAGKWMEIFKLNFQSFFLVKDSANFKSFFSLAPSHFRRYRIVEVSWTLWSGLWQTTAKSIKNENSFVGEAEKYWIYFFLCAPKFFRVRKLCKLVMEKMLTQKAQIVWKL